MTVLQGVMGERTPLMNYYFVEFSFLFTVPVLIVLVTLFLLKERKLIIPWWIASITTLAFSLMLKYMLARDRPFVAYPELFTALATEAAYSFPSARTAVIFAALPIMSKYQPRFFPFWFFLAVVVAYSRVYLGVHYMSDIFGGMLIGYIFGKLTLYTAERMHKL
jgi:undecaprenyl-diphosphatase